MYKRKQPLGRDNKKIISYFTIKTSCFPCQTQSKQNKKIKIKGSLETLRHLNKTLYWLPPTLGRSIVLNDLKKKRREMRKEEEGRREMNRREVKGRGKLTIY